MTMRVTVAVNTRGFERFLATAARKQVPFATARALTLTAKDAQAEMRRELPARFTIRSQRVVQGFRIRPATKRVQVSEMGSIDDFMVKFEEGGIKKPRRSRRLAIPTGAVKRSKTGRIPLAKRPRRLLNRRDVFETEGPRGQAIVQRTKAGLKTLFHLRRKAKIEPRLGLQETARKIAARRMNRHFIEGMAKALKTAR